MAASFAVFLLFRWGIYGGRQEFNQHNLEALVLSALVVSGVWIPVAFLSKPDPAAFEHLKAFYRQVRPSFGWGPVARAVALEDGEPVRTDPLRPMLTGWIGSTVCIYAGIIGFGRLFLLEYGSAAPWLALFALTVAITVRAVREMVAPSLAVTGGSPGAMTPWRPDRVEMPPST